MTDIPWKTYIEPVRHTLAEVTQDNALDFCLEFGWSLRYMEKAVPPHPTGRAQVMQIAGAGTRGLSDYTDVPFWVEMRAGSAYRANAPRNSWKEED